MKSTDFLDTNIQVNEDINQKDSIRIDVPLLIRLLEYAREDAKTDLDLHDVAEQLIDLSSTGQILTMKDYTKICNIKKRNN